MSAKFYYRFAAHIPNRGFVLFSPEWCGCEVVSDGGMLFFAIGLESVFWLCVWALWLIWKGIDR